MIKTILLHLLGRKTTYRLGRGLYMQARGDIPNGLWTNGEGFVQKCVVNAWKRGGLKRRLTIFDVGANIGDWSKNMLNAVGDLADNDSIALYLFEPVPATAEILRSNLGDSESLHYELMAMSSENGHGFMFAQEGVVGCGTNSLHQSEGAVELSRIPITKITANEYCTSNNLDSIDFLKCDAEGHDMDVIEGALPLLKQGRISVFQFEYNHRWIFSRHFLKDVFDAIEDLPYKVGKVCPDHIELYDSWCPEHDKFFEGNYVLLRDDIHSWFRIQNVTNEFNNTLVPRA